MKITIWCSVCGQTTTGTLDMETGAINATCTTCDAVTDTHAK